jgi:hypothetical protein
MSAPEFRDKWTHGAHAYPEADTFAAAKEGFKRRRKDVIFHMTNDGEPGDVECLFCNGKLREPALAASKDMGNDTTVESPASTRADLHSTWSYNAKGKFVYGGMHYVCSWSNLLGKISAIRQF